MNAMTYQTYAVIARGYGSIFDSENVNMCNCDVICQGMSCPTVAFIVKLRFWCTIYTMCVEYKDEPN